MGFQKEDLDLMLVPAGLLIMFAYHIHLLYRYLYSPHTTFMGYENNDKEGWVEAIMKVSMTPTSFISVFNQMDFGRPSYL